MLRHTKRSIGSKPDCSSSVIGHSVESDRVDRTACEGAAHRRRRKRRHGVASLRFTRLDDSPVYIGSVGSGPSRRLVEFMHNVRRVPPGTIPLMTISVRRPPGLHLAAPNRAPTTLTQSVPRASGVRRRSSDRPTDRPTEYCAAVPARPHLPLYCCWRR